MFWTGTVRCKSCTKEVTVAMKDWVIPDLGIMDDEKEKELSGWSELKLVKEPYDYSAVCGQCTGEES